jgi:hypothetical protein
MNLRDQGHRFCISPDLQEARWLHQSEITHRHPDWTDVTDWEDARLVAFLTAKPLPIGLAQCQAAQLDIFNDSKESAA